MIKSKNVRSLIGILAISFLTVVLAVSTCMGGDEGKMTMKQGDKMMEESGMMAEDGRTMNEEMMGDGKMMGDCMKDDAGMMDETKPMMNDGETMMKKKSDM